MNAPLRFVRKGLSLYHVFSDDVQLGWMDDRTVGLFGYDTPEDARCAGTTAYVVAVGWHAAPTHDGQTGARWRDPDAVAPEDGIEVDGVVVGRVVRTPSRDGGKERYGFELARARGQTFAASVHQFHRLLAMGPTAHVPAGDGRARVELHAWPSDPTTPPAR